MPVLNEDDGAGAGADDDSDSRQRRCSCLPFCFWGGAGRRPNKSAAGAHQAKRRRRRSGIRFRLRLSWPAWFRRSGKGDAGGDDDGSSEKGKRRRRQQGGRRLLLLLTTSLQPKKALASVVSGDGSALLPVPAKVSSYGDDAKNKKQSNRRTRRPTVDDADAGSSGRQTQSSSTAETATAASTGSATAHARSRPETTTSQAPSPRPTDGPAGAAGRTWRAPSRRQRHSVRQPGEDCSSSGGGLWTAATTLGVIVLLGRVAAVVFLCSCLYGARFVRTWAAGGGAGASSAKAQSSGGGVAGVTVLGDPVGVAAGDKQVVAEMMCATEDCKKKVVMAGLLDRAGRTSSSRFGR